MANETDRQVLWTIMDLYRGLGLSASFNGNKSEGELLVLFASLTYLRQHNSLIVKPEKEVLDSELLICSDKGICICCAADVADETCNEEFIKLLKFTLVQFKFADKKEIIIELANVLNHIELEENEWLKFFDDFLYSFPGRSRGEFTQPHELSELANYLLDSKARHFFDPFGGVMDFATTIVKGIDYRYTANEVNATVRDIAMFRLALGGFLNQCIINHRSSENWIGSDERFDAIITNPPFGMRIQVWYGNETVNENAELVALKRFEDSTYHNGQLITVVPVSFLYGEAANMRLLREKLTKKNLLDCVIQLPGGIFPNTGLVTAIVVLKKQREKGQRIKFIDASICVVKDGRQNVLDVDAVKRLYEEGRLEVTTEELLNQDCSWDVQWYWNKMNAKFSQGYTIVKLSDVLEPVQGTRRYTETIGRFVSVGSLSLDYFDYEKSPEDFAEKESLAHAYKLTEPAILVSTVGAPKPTYCKASEASPVFVKNDVCAFRITNKTIHEGYLCMELAKRLIPTAGVLYPRLSRTQILKTFVEFPSLDGERSYVEQKNIFDEAMKMDQLAKVQQIGLQKVIDALKDEHLKEIHARKHAIMQNTSSLALAWDNLVNYLENNNGRFDLNDVIGRRHPIMVKELLDSISTNVKIIDVQAQHLTEVEYDWGEEEEFYLQDFIEDYISKHKSTQFSYLFINDNRVWMKGRYDDISEYWHGEVVPNRKLRMPKNALRQVFDNIVSNAVSHGFTQQGRRYIIDFDFEYEFENIVLEISNNGEPMLEGVNTEYVRTYGSSTKLNVIEEDKKTVHSGIGGYDIYNILKKFNAEFEVVSTPDSEWTVCYRIIFHDVLNSNYIIDIDE